MRKWLFVWIMVFAVSWICAQEAAAPFPQNNGQLKPVEDETQKKLRLEYEAVKQLNATQQRLAQYEDEAGNLPVQELIQKLIERAQVLDEQLQNAELERVTHGLYRLDLLERHLRSLQPQDGIALDVAILGDSSVNINDVGFNEVVLGTLLRQVKRKNPQAVFFTGNMVYAFEEKSGNSGIVRLPTETDIFGKIVSSEKGTFNLSDFERKLTFFAKVVKDNLGSTPFYPLMGEYETLDERSLEVVKKVFNLEDARILNGKQLAYTVPLGNALFIVFSTDYFSRSQEGDIATEVTDTAFSWLEDVLRNQGPKYRFRVVLGNDPAFSTTASSGLYKGLDRNEGQRNRFWGLLKKHDVLAYFSGNEILYDRSFRSGIWQFISGGAGATHDYGIVDDTFYHFLFLSLPQGKAGEPKVTVFDILGKVRDTVSLVPKSGAIFDLRVTKD